MGKAGVRHSFLQVWTKAEVCGSRVSNCGGNFLTPLFWTMVKAEFSIVVLVLQLVPKRPKQILPLPPFQLSYVSYFNHWIISFCLKKLEWILFLFCFVLFFVCFVFFCNQGPWPILQTSHKIISLKMSRGRRFFPQ